MSLRAGNAVDEYRAPPECDELLDAPTPEYFEDNHWGIHHLDAESYRYYVPLLIRYGLEHLHDPSSMAIDTFLFSLRPPDREPPRFDFSAEQRQALVAFLDRLAFEEGSAWSEPAMLALEEYWGPGAIYADKGAT